MLSEKTKIIIIDFEKYDYYTRDTLPMPTAQFTKDIAEATLLDKSEGLKLIKHLRALGAKVTFEQFKTAEKYKRYTEQEKLVKRAVKQIIKEKKNIVEAYKNGGSYADR